MKPLVAIIGNGDVVEGSPAYQTAREAAKALIDAGYRIQTGGLHGVMEAAHRGAKDSETYQEGDALAIVPGFQHEDANQYADTVVASGLGVFRNGITANADAVVAVGGGSGTLSEMAIAWTLGRMVVAFDNIEGWGRELAGKPIDNKDRAVSIEDKVHPVSDARALVTLLKENLQHYK